MLTPESFTRRQFLQTGFLVSGVLASAVPAPVFAAITKPERDAFRGLKVGMASYTLRKFSLDQAIAMTRHAGLKYINLKDVHLPLSSTSAERGAAARKIQESGLLLIGGGVIYMKHNGGIANIPSCGGRQHCQDAARPERFTMTILAKNRQADYELGCTAGVIKSGWRKRRH